MQQIFLKDLLYSRHCAGLRNRNKQGRASALTGKTGAHSHNEATEATGLRQCAQGRQHSLVLQSLSAAESDILGLNPSSTTSYVTLAIT